MYKNWIVTKLVRIEISLPYDDVYTSLICFSYQPDDDPMGFKHVAE